MCRRGSAPTPTSAILSKPSWCFDRWVDTSSNKHRQSGRLAEWRAELSDGVASGHRAETRV
eukprot:8344485-Alexandrium_andersonii.AAC.1